jgi:hypothetical protein
MPHTIGLIVRDTDALREFAIFVKTLEQWHKDATLCIFTDSDMEAKIVAQVKEQKFTSKIVTKVALDAYKGLTKQDMEANRGIIYDNQYKDFCYEKANLLDWMFETQSAENGFWYSDCALSFFAPLPEIPEGKTIALSPHYMRLGEQKLYGTYSSGFLWIKGRALLNVWRANGHGAKYLDQSALEEVASEAKAKESVYEFPEQVNFGWWRMFQSSAFPADIGNKFSIFRNEPSMGIRYDGKPLQSIYTHWQEKESMAAAFNTWLNGYTLKLATHKPIALYRKLVGIEIKPAAQAKDKKTDGKAKKKVGK